MPRGIPANANTWTYNNDASAALTNQAAKAAVTGKKMYLTHLFFNSAPGGTIAVLDASGGAVKFGTITVPATGTVPLIDLSANPHLIGDSKAAYVTTTGAGVACIYLAGFWL